MEKSKHSKYCIVPMCQNTILRTPEKKFFAVPRNEKQRKLWFLACHRDPMSRIGSRFVCEDHFELREDLDNFWQFTLQPGIKARFKESVVPHIFHCQGRNVPTLSPRLTLQRRKQRQLIADILSAPD
ncbi:hypothetical protein B566_EDAN016959, partial [Ephemera danica]